VSDTSDTSDTYLNAPHWHWPPHRATTMSVTDAVRVTAPLVPVIVTAYVPTGVDLSVVTVKVDELPVAGFGANVPAAPAGSPPTDRLTASAKPPLLVIVTAYVVLCPRLIVCDAGDADNVKSGAPAA